VIVVSAIQSSGKENVGKENNKSSIFLSYIFLSAGRNDDHGLETERYEFYRHALTEAKEDGVEPEDVVYVLLTGKIIEEYPERERLLIYGEMSNQLPLHVVCDLSDEDMMYIPTVYIPSKEEWVKFQIRKKRTGKKKKK